MKPDRERASAVLRLKAVVGRSTKRLVRYVRPGWAAVLHHPGLDRGAACALIERGVGAVVNFAPSILPGGPSAGAALLVQAGVPLFDVDRRVGAIGAGTDVWDLFAALETLSRPPLFVFRPGRRRQTARLGGIKLSLVAVDTRSLAGAGRIERRLYPSVFGVFVRNTAEHMMREWRDVLTPLVVPEFRDLAGRAAIIVSRGIGTAWALRRALPFLKDMLGTDAWRFLAVDGGADDLLSLGLPIDAVVGDMDSVGESALQAARRRFMHAYPDGRAPGAARLDRLGLSYTLVPAIGTSEDLAVRLAADNGAERIVLFGVGADLLAARERGRRGLSSTYLVRLKYGERMIDMSALGSFSAADRLRGADRPVTAERLCAADRQKTAAWPPSVDRLEAAQRPSSGERP